MCVVCVWCVPISMRGMPPQPRPPSRRATWLRPLPAPQSPDCVRGRVHRHAALRVRRAQLKAAAFPAQHIRSALSQGWPYGRRTAGSGGFLRGAASACGAVCRRPARSEYLPSPDRRHLACLRPRLPPSPPPPRAAAPPARSAPPWHGEGTTIGHWGKPPAKGLFYNGFVGSVPTVAHSCGRPTLRP